MELLYLGTAAAEAVPAVFCTCPACKHAWQTGGKEVRTRSGALVDGLLKLDVGPDSYLQLLKNRLDYARVHSVLITHTHEDHLLVGDIACRHQGYAHLPENDPPMTLYGNERLGALLAPYFNDRVAFQRVRPFETVQIEGYAVTPLEAVHCVSSASGAGWPVVFEGRAYTRAEEAMFYLIEKNGESILYAHDTDEFTPADMEFLAGKKIDLISLDCTNGRLHCDYIGHMGAQENLRMKERLLANGAADGHTLFVANHFSHNGLLPYAEMEKLLPGFLVSYDSMLVSTKAGLVR